MPWRRLPITLLLALALLGILDSRGLAWAHSPLEPGTEVLSEIAATSTGWALTAAPEAPGVPWPALAIVALAVALGWRRPRRAAAVALVLLLGAFAFEDGLHSVHHGLDKVQASSCPVAAAGTHLHATPADGIAPSDVILSMVGLAVETTSSNPIARLASPEQGRAPPRLHV